MGPGGGFVFLVQLPNFLVTQIVCCQDTAREFIWLRRHLQPTRFPLQHSRTACRHAVAPYGPAGRVLVDPLPSLRGGTPKEAEGVCTPPGRHKLELSTINRQKNVAQKKKKKLKGKKIPSVAPLQSTNRAGNMASKTFQLGLSSTTTGTQEATKRNSDQGRFLRG